MLLPADSPLWLSPSSSGRLFVQRPAIASRIKINTLSPARLAAITLLQAQRAGRSNTTRRQQNHSTTVGNPLRLLVLAKDVKQRKTEEKAKAAARSGWRREPRRPRLRKGLREDQGTCGVQQGGGQGSRGFQQGDGEGSRGVQQGSRREQGRPQKGQEDRPGRGSLGQGSRGGKEEEGSREGSGPHGEEDASGPSGQEPKGPLGDWGWPRSI